MVEVGQKVRFDPFACIGGSGADMLRGDEVTGVVVMVHHKHRWFSVVYGEPPQRTSFNFADIGEAVTICGIC